MSVIDLLLQPSTFNILSSLPELQQISRLAVERFADRFQGAEAHRLGFPGFQDGEVGQGDVHTEAENLRDEEGESGHEQRIGTQRELASDHVQSDEEGLGFHGG